MAQNWVWKTQIFSSRRPKIRNLGYTCPYFCINPLNTELNPIYQ